MTIVVGVAAPDGLILAGDSRTTMFFDDGGHRIVSDCAQKVFDVCGFGIATYGEGFVDGKTIAGQIDEFIAQLLSDPENMPEDPEALATRLGEFFQPRLLQWYEDRGEPWVPDMGWQLGFLVAGYDSNGVGGLTEVRIPRDPDPEVLPLPPTTKTRGFAHRGETDVIDRLIAGFDRERVRTVGVNLSDDVLRMLAGLEYGMLFPVSLQDAIDLAHFFIYTTIGMQRFSHGTAAMPNGVPTCGGPITTLAITRQKTEPVDPRPLSTGPQHGRAEGAR